MAEVASRDLREDTAGVLHRVRNGEDVVITHNGRAVARMVAVTGGGRHWIPRDELGRRLLSGWADPGLKADLARLAGHPLGAEGDAADGRAPT